MTERILVVDDEPTNRTLARAVLEGSYAVSEAASVAEALAAHAAEPADLVLMDVMMPGTSGIEGCRRFKALQEPYFLPVILLTALSEQDDRNLGLAAGADDFISKPFDRRELKLRIAAFLRIRRQAREIREQLCMLEELSALKDDLVSLLVHDLRNPLAAAMMVAETMRLHGVAPDDTAAIVRACRRMESLVDQILTVRQLEEGGAEARLEEGAVLPIAAAAMETLSATAEARGVAVKLSGDRELRARIDGDLVRRALENLLGNALRHAPRDTSVDVAIANEGGRLRVSVADRGPGVPTNFSERVFEKFGTVGACRAGGRMGFGLGLYLVRLVAGVHGGHAKVENRPGGGAIFRLDLGPICP